MRLAKGLPHPASWASAVVLFFFAWGVSIAWAVAVPLILELMRHSPRLGWLAFLLLWLAPIPAATLVHRLIHRALDFADVSAERGAWTKAATLWTGFFAWMAIIFATTTTSFVMLVLDPPPMDDPDAALALMVQVKSIGEGVVRTAVWIVIAAYVYEIERCASRS